MKFLSPVAAFVTLLLAGPSEARLGKKQKQRCVASLKEGGVDLSLVAMGANDWTDDKMKKSFSQHQYQVVNKGTAAACNVEVFIPSNSQVFSSYGGTIKAVDGGFHATLPEVPQGGLATNATTGSVLGIILESNKAARMGDACITKYQACKK